MLDMRDLTAQDLQRLSVEQAQTVVEHIRRQAREIALKEAELEKLSFEVARLRAWKFSARTEAMNAQQRQMFEDTLAEDEAQLQALRAPEAKDRQPRRQPRR